LPDGRVFFDANPALRGWATFILSLPDKSLQQSGHRKQPLRHFKPSGF
jgi:hypothetical protein